MSDYAHETISMDDLRAGFGKELLDEAEVIIAVDADSQEEVLHGKWDWELAIAVGHESELSVVRVELEVSDDVDELKEMIETVQSAGADEEEDPIDEDDT
ncbi:MAG: hypothetical protein PVI86_05710 [Phycisphaerae bacterium]|jgi:hypothetical protein